MPQNKPNIHKKYQHLPLQDPPEFTQIGILGLRIYRLATLPACPSPLLSKLTNKFYHYTLPLCHGNRAYFPLGKVCT
jgi:hypothetical protein